MRIRIIGLPLLFVSGLVQAQTTGTTSPDEQIKDAVPLPFGHCFSHVPLRTEGQTDPNAPITVTADVLNATKDGKVLYRGDVEVLQGERRFHSDYMELEQQSRDVLAKGNIRLTDGTITVESDTTLTGNLTTKDTELDQARYQLHGDPGRGHARKVTLAGERAEVDLKEASYTTCPPGEEAWQLKASTVSVEQDEVFGEAWNAVLWLGDVPVFYFPYIKFPVKDERQSGFLYPSFDISSSNGADIRLPYYWNIAPNYDATITPRYIEKRGAMAQLEFRYMPTEGHNGVLYGEYLHEDKKLANDPALAGEEWRDDARWLFSWQHSARFDAAGHWRGNIDYTQVAGWDYAYLDDFDPPVGTLVDNQLLQSFQGGYYDRHWQLTTEIRDYQILKPELDTQPFQLMPALVLNSYRGLGDFDIALDSELARFENSDEQAYQATRFHIEPRLIYSLIDQPGLQLKADVGAYYTHYEQDIPTALAPYYLNQWGFDTNTLDTSVDRLLPRMRINGGLVFDRQARWFEQDFTQTLEPQFQYLYVPYENQDNIGLYDSTTMRQDYYSLFSDRRFAGLDRISDANQLTAGFTSRIYDDSGTERLRLALAQTFNFTAPRVKLYPGEQLDKTKQSFLTFEGDLNLDNSWFIHGEAQHDTRNNQLAAGNITLEYNEQGKLAQLGFRHLNEAYFSDSISNELNQVGGTLFWPVAPQWGLIGAYYRDIELHRNIDTLIGLRYDSCCWAVSLVWEQWQKEDKLFNPTSTTQETSIGLRFELKGFSSLGTGSEFEPGTELLPYYRPFNLNN
ncbi:LPS assembly protein LptD [Oceanimonas baumannii]|uniref:LPS-assembly protein LptD n=1 Tax=Oceanimonas baumannii TaxID=129578 RepID=A0A235CET9_9GAMM|nr:LPS assembly protein LptD [Oceanimonas baumannii]OYD22956.1 LPS assembly protein LptD [Oceanimonas baumannii]TDW54054.1 LPS-assembly protein [Oceanimonas baumannii]